MAENSWVMHISLFPISPREGSSAGLLREHTRSIQGVILCSMHTLQKAPIMDRAGSWSDVPLTRAAHAASLSMKKIVCPVPRNWTR